MVPHLCQHRAGLRGPPPAPGRRPCGSPPELQGQVRVQAAFGQSGTPTFSARQRQSHKGVAGRQPNEAPPRSAGWAAARSPSCSEARVSSLSFPLAAATVGEAQGLGGGGLLPPQLRGDPA